MSELASAAAADAEAAMTSSRAVALRCTLTAFYQAHAPEETASDPAKVEHLVARVVGGPRCEIGGMVVGGVLWSEAELFVKLEAKYGAKVVEVDAAAAAAAIDGTAPRRWEAFGPHLSHDFADGERVFVMKSRGKNRGCRPFAAAVVVGEETKGRRTVRYKDGSTYAARPRLLVPVWGGPLTLFSATTRAYRHAAATQDVGAKVLEIGCDQGETTKRLAARGCAVLAVDKADDRLGSARAAVPGSAFMLCDVLREPDRIQGAFDAIFIDINGSRAYDTVFECVRWAERRWPSALVVVKSSEAMRRHFPGAIEADAPVRQRA